MKTKRKIGWSTRIICFHDMTHVEQINQYGFVRSFRLYKGEFANEEPKYLTPANVVWC